MALARVWEMFAVAWLALVWCSDVPAHTRSESFSRWQYQDGLLNLRFTVSEREGAGIPSSGPGVPPDLELARYLERHIDVQDPANTCRRTGAFRAIDARPGYLQASAYWNCAEAPAWLAVTAFSDRAAEHAHFATLELAGVTTQRLLTRERTVWNIAAEAPSVAASESDFIAFVTRGFRHILSGPDHILFLLVLLLACRRATEVFWAVSGFTLGHSLTLGLAATGVIEPRLKVVEAAIGLTIALVAVERGIHGARTALPVAMAGSALLVLLTPVSIWLGGPAPGLLAALALFVFCYLLLAHRAVASGMFKVTITALFGLVHGLGFASAFLVSGLQPKQLLWPLAGFNLGVELGQLAVVAPMALVAMALRTRPRVASLSADLAAATACAVGLYWFVQRGFS